MLGRRLFLIGGGSEQLSRKKRQLTNYAERHARGEWIASTRVEMLFGRSTGNGTTSPYNTENSATMQTSRHEPDGSRNIREALFPLQHPFQHATEPFRQEKRQKCLPDCGIPRTTSQRTKQPQESPCQSFLLCRPVKVTGGAKPADMMRFHVFRTAVFLQKSRNNDIENDIASFVADSMGCVVNIDPILNQDFADPVKRTYQRCPQPKIIIFGIR